MSVLTQPKRQIAFKLESVEGTPESLAAADAKHLVLDEDLSFSDDIQMHERNIVQSSFSKHKALAGVEGAGITFGIELRGSGAIASPTDDIPSWDEPLRGCGFGRSNVTKLAIGAVAGGPFTHGEVVTGGTSTATGRVIGDWADGAAALYVVVTSGTFQDAETLTGDTSGASATAGAAPAAGGWVYEPVSGTSSSGTIATYHDGVKKLVQGGRGNVVFQGSVGEPGKMMFSYGGVYGGVTDVALLSGIIYEPTLPPVLKGTSLSFDSFTPIVTEFSFDMGNVLALRRSMAATAGAVSTRITDRRPTGSFDPEMDLVANFDFYGRKKGETLHKTEFQVGSTEGNRFKFIVPETQINSVEEGDRERLSTVSLGIGLIGGTSWQDLELSLLVY